MNNIKQKINTFSWKEVMSFRAELYGLSALWIVFYHIYKYTDCSTSNKLVQLILVIIGKGRSGVELFLFLSAVSLYYSLNKNDTKTFYLNRVKKIVPAYLVCALPYFIWYDFIACKDGIWEFLLNILTLNYWIEGISFPLWFVAFIIIVYAIYPLLFKMDRRTKHVSTIIIMLIFIAIEWVILRYNGWLFENFEMCLSRIPIFLFGLILAGRINSGKKIELYKVAVLTAIGFVSFYMSYKVDNLILRRYCEGIVIVCMIILYAFVRNIGVLRIIGVGLKFLGGISLEIYMVHVLVFFKWLNTYDIWQNLHPILWFFIIPIVSIPIAKLVSYFSSKIVVLIKHEQRQPNC